MKRILLITAGLLAVCVVLVFLMLDDGKCQYGVFVRNETSATVTVKYQTPVGLEGMESGTVRVEAGTRGEIFQTVPFQTANGSSDIDPSHCTQVADYLVVYNDDDVRCIIEWCDPRIELVREDLGQGSFEVVVRNENFNPTPEEPDPNLP